MAFELEPFDRFLVHHVVVSTEWRTQDPCAPGFIPVNAPRNLYLLDWLVELRWPSDYLGADFPEGREGAPECELRSMTLETTELIRHGQGRPPLWLFQDWWPLGRHRWKRGVNLYLGLVARTPCEVRAHFRCEPGTE